MSYAGPDRTIIPPPPVKGTRAEARSPARPAAAIENDTDWRQVAVFGAGLALGIAIGAGAALLAAPQSGEKTRAMLRRRSRHTASTLGRRSEEAWNDVRRELRSAVKELRLRKIRHDVRSDLKREIDREAAADHE